MSYISIDGKKAYYEVVGTGSPILILNGIMMSTRSWDVFMGTLAHANQIIRLDFFDQGQSDRLDNETYTQQKQVELVHALLNELDLPMVDLVGISYGGEVATQVAIAYPKRIRRLLLFNTTAYTNAWLKEIGKSWIAVGDTRDGKAYYQTTIPVIYSSRFYEEQIEWMQKRESILVPYFSNPIFLDAMKRLIISAESYDVRETLQLIEAKTLVVTAEEDVLTPPLEQATLVDSIRGAEWIKIPRAGHASMYEKPLMFTTLVLGFFHAKDDYYSL